MESSRQFTSPPLVVLPSITRAAVETAAESLAASGFAALAHW
jgi:hypothetical protein